jgi:hypothetical protein
MMSAEIVKTPRCVLFLAPFPGREIESRAGTYHDTDAMAQVAHCRSYLAKPDELAPIPSGGIGQVRDGSGTRRPLEDRQFIKRADEWTGGIASDCRTGGQLANFPQSHPGRRTVENALASRCQPRPNISNIKRYRLAAAFLPVRLAMS